MMPKPAEVSRKPKPEASPRSAMFVAVLSTMLQTSQARIAITSACHTSARLPGSRQKETRVLAGPLACGALPDYDRINAWAGEAVVGSDGPLFYPWGNGAERVLGNRDPGARVVGLAFNRHGPLELSAAVQDGVAAALAYGTRALADVGARPRVVRAGRANLFLSERFCRAFAELTGAPLELYDTDGAQGAARGAGVGAGAYATHAEALAGVHRVGVFAPGGPDADAYADLYARWTAGLSAAPAA